MSINSRPKMILFIAIFSFIVNYASDNYKKWKLPGWLYFTQSPYVFLAADLLSLLSVLGLVYLIYRYFEEMEGASRRSKTMLKWSFYGLLGVTALRIPLEFAGLLMKLHGNG
ncbi:hypothetical protein AB4Z01_10480 [Inquilinus sp. YAF38]|uniref:hypothetical protein n=1 Tax=Inquilinus sp. YAF38 TaxID=3233084 RepID=UPI003F8FDBBA